MPFPKILIDSATGSDSAASGAGPSTALTGSSASTSSDGLTVTLDGSPDLSGVATDGSHVIYLNHTAGRNFSAISAVDNSAKTVTVTGQAFTGSLTGKSWAIGGKRASLSSSSSLKLCEISGGNGDAMPGWIIEFADGHTETVGSTINLRRAGNTTDGPITIQGVSGASTTPVLSMSANTSAFTPRVAGWELRRFEIRSTGSKTGTLASGSFAINAQNGPCLYRDLKITSSSSGNNWVAGVRLAYGLVENCEITGCVTGIYVPASLAGKVLGCRIHTCTGDAINLSDVSTNQKICQFDDCLIYSNTGNGIYWVSTRTDMQTNIHINNCTFYDNGGDGIEIDCVTAALGCAVIRNCIFSENTGYGINFSGSGASTVMLNFYNARVLSCLYYNNTAGDCNLTLGTSVETGKVSGDPGFTNAAGGDFTPGTNAKGVAYPGLIAFGSSTSYGDIGAVQREEPAAGGGLLRHPGMSGGING